MGGFIFKWGVRPMVCIGFEWGVSEKNYRMGGTSPLWETLYRLLVFLNWVPSSQIYPLNAIKLD